MEMRLPGQTHPVFVGTFAVEAAFVCIEGGDKARPLLSQDLNFEYEQNVIRMYEVGTKYQYSMIGRAQGTASLGQLAGLRPSVFKFFKLCSNSIDTHDSEVCFEFAPSDKNNMLESGSIALSGMLVQSVGLCIASGPVLSSEQVHASFVSARVE
jgi:hypothetical protein